MCARVLSILYILLDENMPGGILGPITHMFGTSDLSTLMHSLNAQVATATLSQKPIIEVFILSL